MWLGRRGQAGGGEGWAALHSWVQLIPALPGIPGAGGSPGPAVPTPSPAGKERPPPSLSPGAGLCSPSPPVPRSAPLCCFKRGDAPKAAEAPQQVHTKYLSTHGWLWARCGSRPSPALLLLVLCASPQIRGTHGCFSSRPRQGVSFARRLLLGILQAAPTGPAWHRRAAAGTRRGCRRIHREPRRCRPPPRNSSRTSVLHPHALLFLPAAAKHPAAGPGARVGEGGAALPSPPRHSSGVKHKSWQGTRAFSGLRSSDS